jgi:hypothetical protein
MLALQDLDLPAREPIRLEAKKPSRARNMVLVQAREAETDRQRHQAQGNTEYLLKFKIFLNMLCLTGKTSSNLSDKT